jgi:hypothetical protein
MTHIPQTLKYHGQLYRLAGQLRLVKKFQGNILPTVRGKQVTTDKEFALFKVSGGTMQGPVHGGFEIVHLPTKFALTFVPFGAGIGQTDAEPDPGHTVTEDAALARAKEILHYYAKNFGGLKTSISEVRGSLRAQGFNYLSFLSAD